MTDRTALLGLHFIDMSSKLPAFKLANEVKITHKQAEGDYRGHVASFSSPTWWRPRLLRPDRPGGELRRPHRPLREAAGDHVALGRRGALDDALRDPAAPIGAAGDGAVAHALGILTKARRGAREGANRGFRAVLLDDVHGFSTFSTILTGFS